MVQSVMVSDRDGVDTLKAGRRGYKSSLTKARNVISTEISEYQAEVNPIFLERRIDTWKERLAKYLAANDAVVCHPKAVTLDDNPDAEAHQAAFNKAWAQVVTFRRTYKAQEPSPADGESGTVAGSNPPLPKLDIKNQGTQGRNIPLGIHEMATTMEQLR